MLGGFLSSLFSLLPPLPPPSAGVERRWCRSSLPTAPFATSSPIPSALPKAESGVGHLTEARMSGKTRQQEVLCRQQFSCVVPRLWDTPVSSKLLEVQYSRDEMKPDSSPITLSSLGLVLPSGGSGDVVGRQLREARYPSEIEKVNPADSSAGTAPAGWGSPSVRGENKNCVNTGYVYIGGYMCLSVRRS